jgi:hypothetical protein
MAWQNTFNAIFGPGLFAGVTAGDWFSLLRECTFAIHPRYAMRFLSITSASFANSLNRKIENWRYGREITEQIVEPPLFILGHWRSGTTHLHGLLSCDDRFAFPNFYQVLYPHSFLLTEAINTTLLSFLMPRTRFGIDNMRMSWDMPYEDEFAIAIMSRISPYVTMSFPRHRQRYDRFLTFCEATPDEITIWKNTLTMFLQKLTWKYRRPLILKSPTHTCRIKLLLELFPNAKFVHIRRNPFHVYPSMQKMMSATNRFWSLQNRDGVDWDERIIQQYREMHVVYFDQRSLIPDGHLHELSFEDLESDPIGQVRAIYQALKLPDFDTFEPKLRDYVATLSEYQKNVLPKLSPDTCKRLTEEWELCFNSWGYPTEPIQ